MYRPVTRFRVGCTTPLCLIGRVTGPIRWALPLLWKYPRLLSVGGIKLGQGGVRDVGGGTKSYPEGQDLHLATKERPAASCCQSSSCSRRFRECLTTWRGLCVNGTKIAGWFYGQEPDCKRHPVDVTRSTNRRSSFHENKSVGVRDRIHVTAGVVEWWKATRPEAVRNGPLKLHI